MTRLARLVLAVLIGFAPAHGMAQPSPAAAPAPAATRPACASASRRLDEEGFVRIGGIEQWVTIKGDSCANPVILVVHGGPGNTVSLYADALYSAWEKDFTLVQWDQRGAGMTYGASPPSADHSLTVDLMTADGVAVARYLVEHLGKRKIILMGSSWGSILGVRMAKARPDLFYAYVGTSQIVRYQDNQQATYGRVLALARLAKDRDTVAKLEALGPPPWTAPRNFGIVRRAVRKYEAMTVDPAPKSWWEPAAQYATAMAAADYDAGEEYSYLQFVGLKGDGMFSQVDLYKLSPKFDVPVFFVQGSEDLLTTPEIARRYFDSLQAPQKAFFLLPRTGHDLNQAMLDTQFKILKERVRPLTK